MLWQRQLHENAVAGRVVVELVDEGQYVGFARLSGKLVLPGIHADFDGLLRLVLDVDLAGRIFADEDDREARFHAVFFDQTRDFRGDFYAHFSCNFLSIDNLRSGHLRRSSRLLFLYKAQEADSFALSRFSISFTSPPIAMDFTRDFAPVTSCAADFGT